MGRQKIPGQEGPKGTSQRKREEKRKRTRRIPIFRKKGSSKGKSSSRSSVPQVLLSGEQHQEYIAWAKGKGKGKKGEKGKKGKKGKTDHGPGKGYGHWTSDGAGAPAKDSEAIPTPEQSGGSYEQYPYYGTGAPDPYEESWPEGDWYGSYEDESSWYTGY